MGILVAGGPEELDIMDWMTRISLELVGQAGLGYSFGTLDSVEAKDDAFASAVKQIMSVKFSSPVNYFWPLSRCHRQAILSHCERRTSISPVVPEAGDPGHPPLHSRSYTIEGSQDSHQYSG